jgi:hypothetical protein
VSGDAAATARNIATNQSLWRWGIAIHALYLFPAAAIGVILPHCQVHVRDLEH